MPVPMPGIERGAAPARRATERAPARACAGPVSAAGGARRRPGRCDALRGRPGAGRAEGRVDGAGQHRVDGRLRVEEVHDVRRGVGMRAVEVPEQRGGGNREPITSTRRARPVRRAGGALLGAQGSQACGRKAVPSMVGAAPRGVRVSSRTRSSPARRCAWRRLLKSTGLRRPGGSGRLPRRRRRCARRRGHAEDRGTQPMVTAWARPRGCLTREPRARLNTPRSRVGCGGSGSGSGGCWGSGSDVWAAYAVSAFGSRLAFNAVPGWWRSVSGCRPHAGYPLLAAAGAAVSAAVAVPLGPWVEFRRKRAGDAGDGPRPLRGAAEHPAAYALGVLGFMKAARGRGRRRGGRHHLPVRPRGRI